MKNFVVDSRSISHIIYYDEHLVLVYSNLYQFTKMSLAEVFELLPLETIEIINSYRYGGTND